jgi:hypothetical protein
MVGLGPPSPEVERIIRANEAAIAAIQSLVVRVRYFQPRPGAPPGSPLEVSEEYTYTMDGPRARLAIDAKFTPRRPDAPPGENPGYSDTVVDDEGSRAIHGYNPADPPALGEFSSSRAVGFLGRPRSGQQRAFSPDPRVHLLMRILPSKDSASLAELAATATATRLIADPSRSPRRCYELRIERPDMNLLVSVDPAVNFMIRRVEFLPTPRSKPAISGFVEADSFQDCGDGAFLPTRLHSEIVGEGSTWRGATECEVVSCNQPLPVDAFTLKFPDWLTVFDEPRGQIHVWGPDDRPRLTFANAEEFHKWWVPRHAQAEAAQPRHTPFSWATVILTSLLGSAALFYIVRRWSRSAP